MSEQPEGVCVHAPSSIRNLSNPYAVIPNSINLGAALRLAVKITPNRTIP
jgi:hypothetical protein